RETSCRGARDPGGESDLRRGAYWDWQPGMTAARMFFILTASPTAALGAPRCSVAAWWSTVFGIAALLAFLRLARVLRSERSVKELHARGRAFTPPETKGA